MRMPPLAHSMDRRHDPQQGTVRTVNLNLTMTQRLSHASAKYPLAIIQVLLEKLPAKKCCVGEAVTPAEGIQQHLKQMKPKKA